MRRGIEAWTGLLGIALLGCGGVAGGRGQDGPARGRVGRLGQGRRHGHSGYRPPSYNEMVGGAQYSRHMYGDGFDIAPIEASLGEAESACTAIGGKLVEYATHVHCDFRFNDVDPHLFGAAAQGVPPALSPDDGYEATIVAIDDGLVVVALGFDEGDPKIRWTALDADGEPIASAEGPSFVPPPGAASVQAIVGGQVAVSWSPAP